STTRTIHLGMPFKFHAQNFIPRSPCVLLRGNYFFLLRDMETINTQMFSGTLGEQEWTNHHETGQQHNTVPQLQSVQRFQSQGYL
ncbi:UNVERIFIED_CONTAM: hypothetical protein K2H54_074357, partial [Gekko kuhli]